MARLTRSTGTDHKWRFENGVIIFPRCDHDEHLTLSFPLRLPPYQSCDAAIPSDSSLLLPPPLLHFFPPIQFRDNPMELLTVDLATFSSQSRDRVHPL